MRRLLALLLAAMLLAPAGAGALTVNDVAQKVRCPTCDVPLDVSNSPIASRMRAYIAERIDRGWSEQRIIDGLVAEFGPDVLTTPARSGFDLVAWVVPGAAVVLGVVALSWAALAWSRRRPQEPAPAPALSEDDARRVQQELERLGP